RYPIRGTFFGCCASAEPQSAKSKAHRTKLLSFRLFISPSHLTQSATVLVLCLNLGRTYTFHCRRKSKRTSKMVGLSCQCLVLVRADFDSQSAGLEFKSRRLIKTYKWLG